MTRLLKERFPHPIGFGAASLSGEGGGYGFGDISEVDALKLVDLAYEYNFRLFDTAPIYGFGLSEQRLGKALKSRREKVFITSKSGVTWHSNKRVDMTNDPKVTQSMLEQSLRDLDTDYIDLFMIHWPDSKVDIRRPLEVLAKAKDQTKIKHIGLCNTYLEDLEKAFEVAPIEVVQSQYNIFNKEIESELFPYLKEKGISFQSWGTLDKGILTGNVNVSREQQKKYDESDCRRSAPWWKQSEVIDKAKKAQRLHQILKEQNISPLAFCLAHNLTQEPTDMVLVGARNFAQVTSLIKALEELPKREIVEEVLNEFFKA